MKTKLFVVAGTALALALSACTTAGAPTPVAPTISPATATVAPATDTAVPATATVAPATATLAPATVVATIAATDAPTLAASTTASSQQTYSDPFAYCAAVGQIDKPDARYTGQLMTDALFKDYLKAAGLDPTTAYPDAFKQNTIWRCMGGQVYACNYGANIPCDSKADTDKTPTQAMQDYCKQNPDSDFIPAVVTGHETVYNWHCVKDQPAIQSQFSAVDAAGYAASFWQVLQPLY